MKVLTTEDTKDFKGNDIKVDIYYLGGRKRDMLVDEYIKTKFKANSESKEADVDYRPYSLKAKVMETYVKGNEPNFDIDDLDADEYDRIFETYFQKKFREIFGGGDEIKN